LWAKVAADVLSRALSELEPAENEDILVGLHAPDDAAVVQIPDGKVMVHTVDYFRAFIDDAYVFGQVSANHALSDIFAMGAKAQSALAIATVPFGLESKVKTSIREMMMGHKVEMTKASSVDVEIDMAALPIMDGALDTIRLGILSSLQPANVRLRRAIRNLDAARDHERYPLMFDPQTSGGLLASMQPERAEACLQALYEMGYEHAAFVGRVRAETDHLEPITLVA